MSYRVIVGPHSVFVECHGVRSETRSIGEISPDDVQAIGFELWETIRPLVSWQIWFLHRLKMAEQREIAAMISEKMPGQFYAGPRPDLISTKPWPQAGHGEWLSVPHGVAARLLRMTK